jgi:hypothetical protein
MKHLRKFEELNYSTYMSFADKVAGLGQTGKADEVRAHALDIVRKEIENNLKFDILVGGVRPFPDAKFTSLDIFKSGSGWVMNVVFQSGSNTHKVTSSVSTTGEITWREGNKFLDRRSVMDFKKMVVKLCESQDDLKSFLSENGLKPEDLNPVMRTFYI